MVYPLRFSSWAGRSRKRCSFASAMRISASPTGTSVRRICRAISIDGDSRVPDHARPARELRLHDRSELVGCAAGDFQAAFGETGFRFFGLQELLYLRVEELHDVRRHSRGPEDAVV